MILRTLGKAQSYQRHSNYFWWPFLLKKNLSEGDEMIKGAVSSDSGGALLFLSAQHPPSFLSLSLLSPLSSLLLFFSVQVANPYF